MDRQPGHQLRRRLWFPVPPRQGIYGLEPGTASLLDGPSPVEMILEADQERLRHQIRAGVDAKILPLAAALIRFGQSLCLLSRASRSAEGKGPVALDITKVGGTPVGFRDVSAAGTLISPSRQPFQISPVCAEPPVIFPSSCSRTSTSRAGLGTDHDRSPPGCYDGQSFRRHGAHLRSDRLQLLLWGVRLRTVDELLFKNLL